MPNIGAWLRRVFLARPITVAIDPKDAELLRRSAENEKGSDEYEKFVRVPGLF